MKVKQKSLNLCREAQVFMDDISLQLKERKISTELDDAAISLFGNTYHNYIEATKTLQTEGLTITSPRGEIKAHPCVKIQLDAQIQLNGLMDRFFLNPKSRKEHPELPEKDKAKSDIEQFLSKENAGKVRDKE